MEKDNEIFCMVIFRLPLIQEGHLSVTVESMVTGNCLGGPSLPRNSDVKLTDDPGMTIAVYREC